VLIGLGGVFLAAVGAAIGLSADFSMSKLLEMVSLEPTQSGSIFILGGYTFMTYSICVVIRKLPLKQKG
jgi:hypothetical protein